MILPTPCSSDEFENENLEYDTTHNILMYSVFKDDSDSEHYDDHLYTLTLLLADVKNCLST